jgi:predicted SAM-dependent methyltransferase
MTETCINLGCGDIYVDSPEWINLDFSPVSSSVRRANLLASLPLPSESARLVYASHFLEHIPKPNVAAFLAECYRVLEPGGVVRLVLPDLQEMAASYLYYREAGDHARADFIVMEIVDQCVRCTTGGELGRYYQRLRTKSSVEQMEMAAFVRERTGNDLYAQTSSPQRHAKKLLWCEIAHWCSRLKNLVQQIWLQTMIRGMPSAFRSQNVRLACVGELHHWLWDFYQLQQTLNDVGFTSIERHSAQTSSIVGFPFYPLDVDIDGRARKGLESMYIEGQKPN